MPWSPACLELRPRGRFFADGVRYGSTEMTNDERERIRYTVEELRQARGRVLKGNSDFLEIVQVIESFGRDHWNKYKLSEINKELARLIKAQKTCDSPDEVMPLLDAMRDGRNEAVHTGTLGVQFARDCVRVSIMIEETLRREAGMKSVADYMVESVVYARLWQTLRTIRRTMMENEFTHLPFENDDQWYVVSAEALCIYRDNHGGAKNHVWSQTLREAWEHECCRLEAPEAVLVKRDECIHQATKKIKGQGMLLVRGECDRGIIGVVTPFDLLV